MHSVYFSHYQKFNETLSPIPKSGVPAVSSQDRFFFINEEKKWHIIETVILYDVYLKINHAADVLNTVGYLLIVCRSSGIWIFFLRHMIQRSREASIPVERYRVTLPDPYRACWWLSFSTHKHSFSLIYYAGWNFWGYW